MKKNYFLSSILVLVLFFTLNVKADTITVMVTNNAFSPTTFNAEVGDVVKWVWDSNGMTHNVTSASQTIPNGAAPIASGDMASGTYTYNITVAGNYGYSCTLHMLSGMVAGFQVSDPTGIATSSFNVLSVYPNPFKDKITVKQNGIEKIQVVNVLGEKIKNIDLAKTEIKTDVYFEGLPAGIYFLNFIKNDETVELVRVIKSE
ncbi:MAG: T9SS type A sorting domain-containing protein [Bacteroidia bacterium]